MLEHYNITFMLYHSNIFVNTLNIFTI